MFDAAFRRAGVLRVNTIAELFDIAELLGKQPRPPGPRLAIVTNGGGPGVLATDTLIANGGNMANAITEAMDGSTSCCRRIGATAIRSTFSAMPAGNVMKRQSKSWPHDHDNDGLLAILAPQAVTRAEPGAERWQRSEARGQANPGQLGWAARACTKARAILDRAGIPDVRISRYRRARVLLMWRYTPALRALYETPALSSRGGKSASREAGIIGCVRKRIARS